MKRLADVLLASSGSRFTLSATARNFGRHMAGLWWPGTLPRYARWEKAHRFLCFKFRTMIPEADALRLACDL